MMGVNICMVTCGQLRKNAKLVFAVSSKYTVRSQKFHAGCPRVQLRPRQVHQPHKKIIMITMSGILMNLSMMMTTTIHISIPHQYNCKLREKIHHCKKQQFIFNLDHVYLEIQFFKLLNYKKIVTPLAYRLPYYTIYSLLIEIATEYREYL